MQIWRLFFEYTNIFKNIFLYKNVESIYMNDFQRIENVLSHLKKSARALSIELGLKNPQVFYDIKAGKCGISKDLALKLQDKYFINAAWLLTGDGEMLRESHSTSPVGNAATSADKSEMQQTQGSPAPTTENITNLIAITREAMAVIREQSAQMNRLITQVELSNARYDRLFASISGVSTGFPATPTDLGVKNPPPIKSELK